MMVESKDLNSSDLNLKEPVILAGKCAKYGGIGYSMRPLVKGI